MQTLSDRSTVVNWALPSLKIKLTVPVILFSSQIIPDGSKPSCASSLKLYKTMKSGSATFEKLNLYKFIFMSFCWFCLKLINVKTAEPIGPKFFEGPDMIRGKGYE